MKIDGENKEVQLVKEEEYDLLKERVAIITGNQSIVDQDFEAQFSDTGKYHIELFRTNLSNADQITGYIQEEGFEDYDLLAFMRGGGTGLDVYDSDKLSQTVLDLRKPFITAL